MTYSENVRQKIISINHEYLTTGKPKTSIQLFDSHEGQIDSNVPVIALIFQTVAAVNMREFTLFVFLGEFFRLFMP